MFYFNNEINSSCYTKNFFLIIIQTDKINILVFLESQIEKKYNMINYTSKTLY